MSKFEKATFAVVLASSVASLASAKDGPFLGTFGGYDLSSRMVENYYGEDFELRDKAFSIGIKGGYDAGISRFYASYFYSSGASYEKKDRGGGHEDEVYRVDAKGTERFLWEGHKVAVGYEARVAVAYDFKVVAGAKFGVAFLNVENVYSRLDDYYYKKSGDYAKTEVGRTGYKAVTTSFLVGVNVGVSYGFGDGHAMDVGVRYERTFSPYSYFDKEGKKRETTWFSSPMQNVGVYVGYSFKF